MTRSKSTGVNWRHLREHSWWFFAPAVVLAVAAVVLDRWTGPSWAALVLAIALAVAALILQRRASTAQQEDQRAAWILESTRTADPSGHLEKVSDVSPRRLGVHRPLVEIDYLRRDAEHELLRLLTAGQPVLVLGASMAGKTRMCAQVLGEHFPDRLIVRPSPPGGLGELMKAGLQPHGAVIWLDDLHHYLSDEGLRAEWIDRLVDAGNLVLATMITSEPALDPGDEETRSPHAGVLERFERVHLREDDDEQQRLADQAGNRRLRRGIRTHGLGQYVGGAYLALQVFDSAQAPPPRGHPLGVAMVRAAADWRRVGLDTITTQTLSQVAPAYLSPHYRHAPGEESAEALAWATQLIKTAVRLLEPTKRPDAFRAPDYLMDHLNDPDRAPTPIPEATWRAAVQHAPAGRRMTVASAAHRHQRYADAETLWRQVVDDPSHPDSAPQAALHLGKLLMYDLGRLDDAEAPLLQAVDSAHPDIAPKAAVNLGLLMHDLDRPGEAMALLRQAIDSAHPVAAPTAAFNLGVLLIEHPDCLEEVEALWVQAAASTDPDIAPHAALNLGHLLRDRLGRPDDAEAPLLQAVDSAHPDIAPRAALSLGILLTHHVGRPDDAEAPLLQAANSAHPEAAAPAALELGDLLMFQLGRPTDAEAPLRQAADSPHPDPDVASHAALNLGTLLKDRLDGVEEGDIPLSEEADALLRQEAEARLRQAAGSTNPDIAPRAALTLGGLLKDNLGRLYDAEAPWRQAAGSTHPDAAPKAAFNLAMLLRDRLGWGEEADAPLRQEVKALLRQAADFTDPDVASPAALELGRLLIYRLDRPDDAVEPLRQAAASTHRDFAPQANLELGNLFSQLRGPAAAVPYWQKAVASDHPTAAHQAAMRLGPRFSQPRPPASAEGA